MLKRIINLVGSVIVRALDIAVDGSRVLIGGKRKPTCMVLAYHSISDKHRPLFAKQMDILLRIAKPVHADIGELPAQGGRYVAVTFDDGLEPILVNALPELRKRSIPATLFIITEKLGCLRSWEHYGGENTAQVRVMSLEQLLAVRSDLVKIASHTETHALLTSVDVKSLRQELRGSRKKLEEWFHCDIKLFGLPYGAFNETVLDECRSAGYERVFTGLPVHAFRQPNEFVTGRVVTEPTDWPIEFRLKVAGAYRWLPHAFELKRRLVTMVRGNKRKPVRLQPDEAVRS